MSEGKGRRSWLEIRVERELNKDAALPVSQEVVEDVTTLERERLQKKRDLQNAKSDSEIEGLIKAAQAKNN